MKFTFTANGKEISAKALTALAADNDSFKFSENCLNKVLMLFVNKFTMNF